MAKRENFSGDFDLLWLNKGTRQRTYRELIQEVEEGKSIIPSKEQLQQQVTQLTDLITETASTTEENSIGRITHTMQEEYLAKADIDTSVAELFGLQVVTVQELDDQGNLVDVTKYEDYEGSYYESITAKIEADANAIVESYSYATTTTVNGLTGDLQEQIYSAVNLFDGQIRRGFITVDDVIYFGIVISSRNVFEVDTKVGADTALAYDNNMKYNPGDFVYYGNYVYECITTISTPEEWTASHWERVGYRPDDDSHCYFAIDTGQCFGLYTATGWQFWVGDQKLGWFDTADGMLHVGDISIDNNLQMGDWKFVNNGSSFGIKYVG